MLGLLAFGTFVAHAQNKGSADTTKKTGGVISLSKPKPYRQVITDSVVTEQGLFRVHKLNDQYFFEIPLALFDKDLLMVTRLSKGPAGDKSAEYSGYQGDELGNTLINFSMGPNDRVFLKRNYYYNLSEDTSENGMYRSLTNSSMPPILLSFDIKAFSPDSNAVVIDITDFIGKDNELFFKQAYGQFQRQDYVKKKMGLLAYQADKSYTESVHSFPVNIEVKMVKTYKTVNDYRSVELNTSIIKLPDIPMKPRLADDRIGYFSTSYFNFDNDSHGVETNEFISRWRLEPKPEEADKYLRGELVEPQKPIVFYIDPATPKKWVPYLIQGVNDWQQAFEQAGFKNAIYAREAPTKEEDSSWSLEDARFSAIVYKPSMMKNASGPPNIRDPRSGELIEAHINWYHNVIRLLHDWYFIQAAAIDPKARRMEFDDSLMGQLIRFVSSHEVGHTLGLAHNFGASSTVPVDSLRNKTWVEAHGHTPSIMDYARFNYVAQPEDGVSEKGIFPRIGAYDKWAIEWGYKWLPQLGSRKEEQAYMNHWISNRLKANRYLWYGSQSKSSIDPRCQSEDLSNDPVKASYYGIQNLKRIVPNLTYWTSKPEEDYKDLRNMYIGVINQYYLYMIRVQKLIGGVQLNYDLHVGDSGARTTYVPRETQKEAVKFFADQLFSKPTWLINPDLNRVIGWGGGDTKLYVLASLQDLVLKLILSQTNFAVLLNFANDEPQRAYTVDELLEDVRKSIWSGLKSHKIFDDYQRNLQKIHVGRLIKLYRGELDIVSYREYTYNATNLNTDIRSILISHMKSLLADIETAIPYYNNNHLLRSHLQDVANRLKEAMDPKIHQLAPTVAEKSDEDQDGVTSDELDVPNVENCSLWCTRVGSYIDRLTY